MTSPNKLPEIPVAEAKELLDAIEKQLRNKFQEIYHDKISPNTRGNDYEKILAKFLQEYLGGAFNFLVRAGVMNNELKVNSVLKETENEFDIVATYKEATPKLVYHHLIPYDSVAFVIEVKQTLKLDYLMHDLKKLDKLSKLQVATPRVNGITSTISNPWKINRPLRILFYFENGAKSEKVYELLDSNLKEAWDICVILSGNVVILNSTLPYVRDRVRERYPDAHTATFLDYPLLKAMFFSCVYIESNFVNSWTLFANLFRVMENELVKRSTTNEHRT